MCLMGLISLILAGGARSQGRLRVALGLGRHGEGCSDERNKASNRDFGHKVMME